MASPGERGLKRSLLGIWPVSTAEDRASEGSGRHGTFPEPVRSPRDTPGVGWMTLGWGLLIPIIVFTGLKASIIWIALMSVWANFVGHFSSWQAARVEVKQDEQIEGAVDTATGAEATVKTKLASGPRLSAA